MSKFYVYIGNAKIVEMDAMDFNYEIYLKACELAEMFGEIASLRDAITGEVLEDSDDWEMLDDSDWEDKDEEYEMYMG